MSLNSAVAYLKQIQVRDEAMIYALLENQLSGDDDQPEADDIVARDIMTNVMGDPTDTKRCMTFNKRQKYIRCPNAARDSGLCSHHCRFVELDQKALRQRDRMIVAQLKSHGIVFKKNVLQRVMSQRSNQYQHCQYYLPGHKRFCRNQVCMQDSLCWKHKQPAAQCAANNAPTCTVTNAVNAGASLKLQSSTNADRSPTSLIITNKSLHRLGGPPGQERCFCCNMTLEALREAFRRNTVSQ